MNQKLLYTALLSISLLPLNLTAQNQMKCTGSNCFVDISGLSKKQDLRVKSEAEMIEDRYSTIILDNIETIVFAKEHYIMTDDEVGEYQLAHQGLEDLTMPVLSAEGLPNSEYYCEDNLKPIKVEGLKNTYECA
jgi:hypothetical protein